MEKSKTLLGSIWLLFATLATAQTINIDSIVTYTINQNKTQIFHLTLPLIDVNALIVEDSLQQLDTVPHPLRYGVPIKQNIDLLNEGTVLTMNNFGKVYAIKLTAYNALGLEPEFNSFNLPQGGILYAINDSLKIIDEPLNYSDNQPHGKNVMQLPYSSFYLVYFESDTITQTASINIDQIIFVYKSPFHGSHYRQIGGSTSTHAKSCNEKVFCADWLPVHFAEDHIRAVFGLTVSGWACSGVLINQAVGEREIQPYFLTARHCIVDKVLDPAADPVDLTKMTFWFNFSSSDCSDNIPDDLVNRYKHPIKGATLTRMDYLDDFALLKMNSTPPAHYKAYYAGWTASLLQNVTNALFIGVHHPSKDIKMVSKTFGLTTPTFLKRYVVFWINGTTEGGSSGSPLFNHNGRVIGVLSGGLEGCVIALGTNYGKFRNFWFFHKSVRDALNPDNKLILGISGNETDCYENLQIDGTLWPAKDYQPDNLITLNAEKNITVGGSGKSVVIKSGSEYFFQSGESIDILPDTEIEPGAEFVYEIVPCASFKKSDVEYDYIENSTQTQTHQQNEDSLVAIDMSNSSLFTIYPNPSSDDLICEFHTQKPDYYTLQIYNTMGQKVLSVLENKEYTEGLHSAKIDVTKLGTGTYFLTINNNFSKTTYKFVVSEK